MIRNILSSLKQTIALLSAAVFIAAASQFALPGQAYAADARSAVCSGAGLIQGSNGNCSSTTGSADADVNTAVQTGLNIFSAIIGIIAVVMIMIAGLKYMTSQGDASQINSAKNTILYASIGIVIVVLAQLIVKFVINRISS